MIAKKVTFKNKDYSSIKSLYKKAFPKEERIPFLFLILRSGAEWIDFLAFYEEGQFCGFACLAKGEHLTSVMYLAVESHMRGKGYGSKILTFIRKKYKDHTIVLEIEIVDCKAHNYEQRKMRKDFYLRNGFMESGYGVTLYGVDFEVMKSKEYFRPREWSEISSRLLFGLMKFKIFPMNTFAQDTKTIHERGGIIMAKAGMRRPSPYDSNNHGTENHHKMNKPKNEQAQVPEIQGAAKTGNEKAGPVNAPNWARSDYKAGSKHDGK